MIGRLVVFGATGDLAGIGLRERRHPVRERLLVIALRGFAGRHETWFSFRHRMIDERAGGDGGRGSAVDEPLHRLGVAGALDGDPAGRSLDVGEVVGRQLNVGVTEAFLEPFQPAVPGMGTIHGRCAGAELDIYRPREETERQILAAYGPRS